MRAFAKGVSHPSVAALWVESDANVPSGESLLRQMLAAHRYCLERFAVEPDIAWLPDTFGFARTLPTLLAHAGIMRFATTKLQWNDTTTFPHARFVVARARRRRSRCGDDGVVRWPTRLAARACRARAQRAADRGLGGDAGGGLTFGRPPGGRRMLGIGSVPHVSSSGWSTSVREFAWSTMTNCISNIIVERTRRITMLSMRTPGSNARSPWLRI